MLVKSAKEAQYLDDLQDSIDTLRLYKMKLNPSKCAFKVASRKFISFMVSQRGIEVNPDKIQAILNMKPLKDVKDVQSIIGRVVALNNLKAYLASTPLLSLSKPGEELYLYLALSLHAVSSALIR